MAAVETADAETAGQTEDSATAAEPATVESTTDAVEPPSDAKTEDKPAEEKVPDINKYFWIGCLRLFFKFQFPLTSMYLYGLLEVNKRKSIRCLIRFLTWKS